MPKVFNNRQMLTLLTHSPLWLLPPLTVCGKVNTSRAHDLSDTQWPWHAAIYIRSPPDHTPNTHRPRGTTTSVQQGASEESTFWSLACSGALLTQRSVLVAAQCVVDKNKLQTLHPAHVKVVIGRKHQGSSSRLKGLHHLRVKIPKKISPVRSFGWKIHQMIYISYFYELETC